MPRSPPIAVGSLIAIGVSGCGTTEKAGQVGGALSVNGPYDFGLDTSSGDDAKLKYPAQSYGDSFETVRDGCGDGWVVFEIPSRRRRTRSPSASRAPARHSTPRPR